MTEWQQRVYAIAGIQQAAACVYQLAYQGKIIPQDAATPLINSVLAIDAESVEDIYASEMAEGENRLPLAIGLRIFLEQFAGAPGVKAKQDGPLKHALNILRMEQVFHKNEAAKAELGKGLIQVARQRNDFNMDNYRITESLAGLYSSIISPLAPPIQVPGKPSLLQQPAIQHQIRSLLLAGIRSAVLWRQLGGKKRHFIFNRRSMVDAAKSLLLTTS